MRRNQSNQWEDVKAVSNDDATLKTCDKIVGDVFAFLYVLRTKNPLLLISQTLNYCFQGGFQKKNKGVQTLRIISKAMPGT